MLKRVRLLVVSSTALTVGCTIGIATPARGDQAGCTKTEVGVICDAHHSGKPGHSGKAGKPNSAPKGHDRCTYRKYSASVPKSDPAWGKKNKDGGLTVQMCPGSNNTVQGGNDGDGHLLAPGGAAAPPPPPPTKAELAEQARSQLKLPAPVIETAPGKGKLALVGLPVWVWMPHGENTGTAGTKTAVRGVSVTATASVGSITYDMGDGTTITCKGFGTPYDPSYGEKPSPDCGHTYRTTSAGRPGGKFTVRATSTWTVHWESTDGRSDDFTVTPGAGVATLRVGEMQVVNGGR